MSIRYHGPLLAAGTMDRRLDLKAKTMVRGSDGGHISTYTTFATVAAAQMPLTSAEANREGGTIGQTTIKFHIRWRRDLKVEMRIACEGLEFDLIGIDEIGRRVGLSILGKAAQS